MGRNTKIINPNTGGTVFGYIPKFSEIEPGEIILSEGDHWGKNRGFGVAHIWAEHQQSLINLGYKTIKDVPLYINEIIQPGTFILSEGEIKHFPRLTLLRNRKGIIILENRGDYTRGVDAYYSIVTAWPKENPHGTVIGKMGVDSMVQATEANR